MIFIITISMLGFYSGIIYKGVPISNFNFMMLIVLPFLFVLYIWIEQKQVCFYRSLQPVKKLRCLKVQKFKSW